MMNKDFTPTQETISLHGLGFIQVVLPNPFSQQRLHVWHPDLPRRRCFVKSSVHNHRFEFTSLVLVGTQVNWPATVEIVKEGTGTHRLISHDGPRSPKGGRLSEEIADCVLHRQDAVEYPVGCSYSMRMLDYHSTPCHGVVVTLMTKGQEGTIHASSVCEKGTVFDQDFDRFQMKPAELWEFVLSALSGVDRSMFTIGGPFTRRPV